LPFGNLAWKSQFLYLNNERKEKGGTLTHMYAERAVELESPDYSPTFVSIAGFLAVIAIVISIVGLRFKIR
jgi:hypothetical protein